MFPAGQGFQKFQCPQICQCFIMNHHPDRFFRISVRTRIYQEWIPRRERISCVCHFIWIDMFYRELTVIEIISPVKNSDNLIFIKLDSIYSVSCGRHRHEAVAHFIKLTGTIISPHICQPMFQKFFDFIVSRNWLIN